VLEVTGLRKSFGSTVAVKDVSFKVARGERFGLLGPNGAGKTTTISVITGTLDADSGSVTVDGEVVSTSSYGAKRKIGYVPQEIALYDEISARDNLRFFGALYGLGATQIARATDAALTLSGLHERAGDDVKTFSGGMKRRLNIAVALMHDPELLVCDEPTVGVDPQSRHAIFETLLKLADAGKTILYTTHYMEEVEKLCPHVAVMDHGEIVANGLLTELQNQHSSAKDVVIELEAPTVLDLITGALNMRQEGASLFFEVDDLTEDLPTVLTSLAESGARIASIRCQSASLEDVFLRLTGSSLRD
jgi:linearmycin/streptolysin S transport system ATP-binding protein